MSYTINKKAILSNFGPEEARHLGIYVLCGTGARRITAISQQHRAISLVECLVSTSGITGKKVAVIGGGIAGCTAAYWAACNGAEVTLYEKQSKLLAVYEKASHRFLHPGLFNWPAAGWDRLDTHLPCLNWRFGTAQSVGRSLRSKLQAFADKAGPQALKLCTGANATVHTGQNYLTIEAIRSCVFKGYPTRSHPDVLIIAVGESEANSSQASYWDAEQDQAFFDEVRRMQRPEVAVLGNGDGGVMDGLRLKSPLHNEEAILSCLDEWKQESHLSYELVTKLFEKCSYPSESEIQNAFGKDGTVFWRRYFNRAMPWQKALRLQWHSRKELFHEGLGNILRVLLAGYRIVSGHSTECQSGVEITEQYIKDLKTTGKRVLVRVASTQGTPISQVEFRQPGEAKILSGKQRTAEFINAYDEFSRWYYEAYNSIASQTDKPYAEISRMTAWMTCSGGEQPSERLLDEVKCGIKKTQDGLARLLIGRALNCDPMGGDHDLGSDRLLKIHTPIQVREWHGPAGITPREGTESFMYPIRQEFKPTTRNLSAVINDYRHKVKRWVFMSEQGGGKSWTTWFLVESLLRKRNPETEPSSAHETCGEMQKISNSLGDSIPVILSSRYINKVLCDRPRRIQSVDDLVSAALFESWMTGQTRPIPTRRDALAQFQTFEWFTDTIPSVVAGTAGILLIVDGMDELADTEQQILSNLLLLAGNNKSGMKLSGIVVTSRIMLGGSGQDLAWYEVISWPRFVIKPMAATGSDSCGVVSRFVGQLADNLSCDSKARESVKSLLWGRLSTVFQDEGSLTPIFVSSAVHLHVLQYQRRMDMYPSFISRWDIVDTYLNEIICNCEANGKASCPNPSHKALLCHGLYNIMMRAGVKSDTKSASNVVRSERLAELTQLYHSLNTDASIPDATLNKLANLLGFFGESIESSSERNAVRCGHELYALWLVGQYICRDDSTYHSVVEAISNGIDGFDRYGLIRLRCAFSLGFTWHGLRTSKSEVFGCLIKRVQCLWSMVIGLTRCNSVSGLTSSICDAEVRRMEFFLTLIGDAARELQVRGCKGDSDLLSLRREVLAMFEHAEIGISARAILGRALGWLGDLRAEVAALNLCGDSTEGVGGSRARWSSEVCCPNDGFWIGGAEPSAGVDGRSTQAEPSGRQEMRGFICRAIRRPFRLSKFPVTVDQFQAFMHDGGYGESAMDRYWPTKGKEFVAGRNCEVNFDLIQDQNVRDVFRAYLMEEIFPLRGPRCMKEDMDTTTPNAPVVGISWYEAVAFCNWLNATVGPQRLGLPSGWIVRLPTEAEWEFAATYRGGKKVQFPWGDAEDDLAMRANCAQAKLNGATSVGLFGPGSAAECGAEEMIGNVMEWCSTRWRETYVGYDRLESEEVPHWGQRSGAGGDLEVESLRVLRGGCWSSSDEKCRPTFRDWGHPAGRYYLVGFRLAASPG